MTIVKPKPKAAPKNRVALFRKRVKRLGLRRVEVMVPAADAARVRAFAGLLRGDGAAAKALRETLASGAKAPTGRALALQLMEGAKDGFALSVPERKRETLRDAGL